MTQLSVRNAPTNWFTIMGERDEALESQLNNRVLKRVEDDEYTLDNVCYVEKVDFSLVKGDLELTEKQLEKLRRLCQLWDIKLRPAEISSHRPVIGPIIVFSKKMLFRLLSVLLKDIFHQQKSFNAAAIDLVADLSSSSKKSS